jgi:hypothetical protein
LGRQVAMIDASGSTSTTTYDAVSKSLLSPMLWEEQRRMRMIIAIAARNPQTSSTTPAAPFMTRWRWQKMINDLEERWKEMKQNFPIGKKLHGEVIRIEPFGVFLNIGYPVLQNFQFSGIIDILTKDDEDSCGLPIDYNSWPKIGEKIYCEVLWHRDLEKEVSLAIVNPKA